MPTGPVDESTLTTLPTDLVQRMLSVRASVDEHRVVLILGLLTRTAQGPDVPISEDALLRHDLVALASSAVGTPIQDETWLWQALEQALVHGLLIRFVAATETAERTWYLLNTIDNARLVAAMASEPSSVPATFWISDVRPLVSLDRPSVFRLYEQNIGPLTPLLAERLIRATETYPVDWIESAIAEAVAYNRRNWRYIERILENWTADGLPNSTGLR